MNTINNIGFMIFFYTSPNYTDNENYSIISILDLLVCVWTIRIVYIFSIYITKLTEEEILFLKKFKY